MDAELSLNQKLRTHRKKIKEDIASINEHEKEAKLLFKQKYPDQAFLSINELNERTIDLIGKAINPRSHYFGDDVYDPVSITKCEHYSRSSMGYCYDKKSPKKYVYESSKKCFEYGGHAHVGNYVNPLQFCGDAPCIAPSFIKTEGSGDLHDLLLTYKRKVTRSLKSHYDELVSDRKMLTITPQDNYACSMIKVSEKTLPRGAKSEALLNTDWPNMITSFIVGLSHYSTYYANQSCKLSFEMYRRSGFGYNDVTIAPTAPSIRINLGLSPQEYVTTVSQLLADLNKVIGYLQFKKTPLKESVFIKKTAYSNYATPELTAKLRSSQANDSYIDLLWSAVEITKNRKGEKQPSKTTLQNILRSAHGRDYVSFNVCSYLIEHKNQHTSLKSTEIKIGLQEKIFHNIVASIKQYHSSEYLSKKNLNKNLSEIENVLKAFWNNTQIVSNKEWAKIEKKLIKNFQNWFATQTRIDELKSTLNHFSLFFCCEHLSTQDTLILSALEYSLIKAIDCIEVNDSLSFDQSKAVINYDTSYKTKTLTPVEDKNYWATITQLATALTLKYNQLNIANTLDESIYKKTAKNLKIEFKSTFEKLAKSISAKQYDLVNNLFTYLNELFFEYSMLTASSINTDYASDSEEETEIVLKNNKKPVIFAKKFVTHNGMLAIISALTCAIGHTNKEKRSSISAITPYYEFEDGVSLLPDFLTVCGINIKNFPQRIEIKKQLNNSNILFIDLAPCLAKGELSQPIDTYIPNIKQEFIIVDSTSILPKDPDLLKLMHLLITRAETKAIVLVESGLKHDQIFDGKTHFGFIRIFTQYQDIRDTFFAKLPLEFQERTAIATSHRRLIKELGGTQTNEQYLEALKNFAEQIDSQSATEVQSKP